MSGSRDGGTGGSTDGTAHGTGPGLCIVVDTATIDEAAERSRRVREAVPEAADGLERLPVVGVAVGADAVLDALCDLGRQWRGGLDAAAHEAQGLLDALRTARTAYARTEIEAERASRTVLGQALQRAGGGRP